jgi:hypothetical protein
MDVFHSWFNLRSGVQDTAFCDRVHAYLGKLQAEGLIASYRITRRKLALGIPELGEFHVAIEVDGLAQLDRAFQTVSTRAGPLEGLHAAMNQEVTDLRSALYRDFPDPQRVRGEEKF